MRQAEWGLGTDDGSTWGELRFGLPRLRGPLRPGPGRSQGRFQLLTCILNPRFLTDGHGGDGREPCNHWEAKKQNAKLT